MFLFCDSSENYSAPKLLRGPTSGRFYNESNKNNLHSLIPYNLLYPPPQPLEPCSSLLPILLATLGVSLCPLRGSGQAICSYVSPHLHVPNLTVYQGSSSTLGFAQPWGSGSPLCLYRTLGPPPGVLTPSFLGSCPYQNFCSSFPSP